MKLLSCSSLAIILLLFSSLDCRQESAETNQIKTSVNSTQIIPNTNVPLAKEAKPMPTEKSIEGKSDGNLACSPKRLQKGDILTLSMNKPHGGYLEIITPTKEYIFISSADDDKLLEDAKKYHIKPYYSASELASLNELKIDTTKAVTLDYKGGEVNGKLLSARIFSVSGKYQILLSKDSFEIDDPTITGQCEVYYTNTDQR